MSTPTQREQQLAEDFDAAWLRASETADTIEQAQARSIEMIARLLADYKAELRGDRMRYAKWISGSGVGESSKTLLGAIIGAPLCPPCAPSDPGDFGRCYNLLQQHPELREHLHLVRDANKDWPALIDNWDELEALYVEHVELCRRRHREPVDGHAIYKLYNRMRELRGHGPVEPPVPKPLKRKRRR